MPQVNSTKQPTINAVRQTATGKLNSSSRLVTTSTTANTLQPTIWTRQKIGTPDHQRGRRPTARDDNSPFIDFSAAFIEPSRPPMLSCRSCHDISPHDKAVHRTRFAARDSQH